MSLVIAIDVDGVVADLHKEWIRRYNKDYDDSITENDIKQWEMEKAVKPQCGRKIYDYLASPDMYRYVIPISGALEGVENLRKIFPTAKIVFASNCGGDTTFDQKLHWLVTHKFLEQKTALKYFIGINDKSLLKADILIDDHGENILSFDGIGLLFDKPYNRSYPITSVWHPRVRVFRWSEIPTVTLNIVNNYKGVNKNVITGRSPIPCVVS